jgi:hypothetical protein
MQQSEVITSNEVKKEYQARRLNRHSLKDLTRLYSEVYGVSVREDYFQKKYDTAYTGVEYAGFIAYNNDNLPIAYYGVIPCFIQYDGGAMLGAQSADTMTHPRYRFKGMFVELSVLTFSLCRELGIRLVFGFPNQNSYHGAVNKLGWQMIDRMECFLIPVRTLPLQSLFGKTKLTSKVYDLYRSFITYWYKKSNKGFMNSMISDGFAGVMRSEDYLEYKRYSRSFSLRVGGIGIWVSRKHGLMLGDISDLDNANLPRFISKLKTLACWLGVRQIQFHCSPGLRCHGILASKFDAATSYPVLIQNFGSTIPVEKLKFTFADIDIF